MVDVICFRTGFCRHPSCMVLRGSGWRPRRFHAHAYLLRTRHGLALFDTGYAHRFADATAHGLYKVYRYVTPVSSIAPLHAQLTASGFDPRQVNTVLLSHFHADHIAGLRDFPHARIMCCGDGWKAVKHQRGIHALRRAFLPDLVPADFESRLYPVEWTRIAELPRELAPFRTGRDLSGEGDIFAVPLPGHAFGHIGLFVKTPEGWTLLAADAAWTQESLVTDRGPSSLSFMVQHSKREYYRTLDMLRRLHAGGRVRIRLAHDDEPDQHGTGEPR